MQCHIAIPGCDGNSLAIAISNWAFRNQNLFFVQEFWQFGSGDAKSSSIGDCDIFGALRFARI